MFLALSQSAIYIVIDQNDNLPPGDGGEGLPAARPVVAL